MISLQAEKADRLLGSTYVVQILLAKAANASYISEEAAQYKGVHIRLQA